jgi:hypothetical protein
LTAFGVVDEVQVGVPDRVFAEIAVDEESGRVFELQDVA